MVESLPVYSAGLGESILDYLWCSVAVGIALPLSRRALAGVEAGVTGPIPFSMNTLPLCSLLACFALVVATLSTRADVVVVFHEIMYHPAAPHSKRPPLRRPAFTQSRLRLLVDVGAAVFLNGSEIARANLPSAAAAATPATNRPGDLTLLVLQTSVKGSYSATTR